MLGNSPASVERRSGLRQPPHGNELLNRRGQVQELLLGPGLGQELERHGTALLALVEGADTGKDGRW